MPPSALQRWNPTSARWRGWLPCPAPRQRRRRDRLRRRQVAVERQPAMAPQPPPCCGTIAPLLAMAGCSARPLLTKESSRRAIGLRLQPNGTDARARSLAHVWLGVGEGRIGSTVSTSPQGRCRETVWKVSQPLRTVPSLIWRSAAFVVVAVCVPDSANRLRRRRGSTERQPQRRPGSAIRPRCDVRSVPYPLGLAPSRSRARPELLPPCPGSPS
jgi:hypothetical protein